MQTLDFVSGLHNFREFSQPLECLYQAIQTEEKVFYCFYKIGNFIPLKDRDVITVFTYSHANTPLSQSECA